ncbi:haloacid dehalogenase type II [Pandoraea sp. NPDC090278]|uniref:haloacid dehalogenase type II n=1 Tax=Pandoraea sp. NPDC090278 TaxID=3364391 RepID=UPI00383B8246
MKRVTAFASPSSSTLPESNRRRTFLLGLGAAATAAYVPTIAAASESPGTPARGNAPPPNRLGVKALVFDVYGTCTDYWSTILDKGKAFNRVNGVDVDWASVAKAWYGLYPDTFREVVSGARPWQSPSLLREEALARVLQRQGYSLAPTQITEFNTLWNELRLWDDVLPGLERLHPRYPLACLSNADMASMVALSRHRKLPWDLVLTGEIVEKFKPAADVYKLAPRFLNLKPEEILMVACHKNDLTGAQAIGMRTAFLRRPTELGPDGKPDTTPDSRFDLNVDNMFELDEVLHNV